MQVVIKDMCSVSRWIRMWLCLVVTVILILGCSDNSSDVLNIVFFGNGQLLQHVSTLQFPSAMRLCTDGDYVYLLDESRGLVIIDVSNPGRPQEVSSMLIGGSDPQNIVVSGSYAYLVNGDSLLVISVANPRSPSRIGGLLTPCWARGLAKSGNYVYVADGCGMIVVSVSNPTNPIIVATAEDPGFPNPSSMAVEGNYAYMGLTISGSMRGGIRVYSVSNPSAPVFMSVNDDPYSVTGIAVQNNMAYLTGSHGLEVVNLLNPTNTISEYDFDNIIDYSYAVTLYRNWAFVAAGMTLEIVDVHNPASPEISMSYRDYSATSNYMDICSSQDYIFIADGNRGLQIFRFVSE